MSKSEDTTGSVRLRKDSPQASDIHDDPKRRRLSDGAQKDQDGLVGQFAEWSLELCPGSDETLQLGRLSGGPSKPLHNARFGENALDSYRLETLATAERALADVGNGELDSQQRWCDVTVSSQHMAVTLDTHIHILSVDCAKQEAVISHDQRIQATALSSGSSFVAFGDTTGMLFIVHIKTRRPVFSQCIVAADSADAAGISALQFTVSGDEQREELVVASASGQAVRFSNIHLDLLDKAIAAGDMVVAAGIKAEIGVEFVQLRENGRLVHDGGITGLAAFHARDHSLVFVSGGGSASLSCWQRIHGASTNLADVVSLECSGSEYTKVRLSPDQRYVVALSVQGSLDVYERSTLTRVFRYADVDIADFGLALPPQPSSTDSSILVTAISNPIYSQSDGDDSDGDGGDDDSGEAHRKLLVVGLPGMEVLYSMDVSAWSWLAQDTRLAADAVDTIMFVEGSADDGTQRLFLRQLQETVPLERLDHFLRAGRFTEAQAFAESAGIPLTTVHRRRLEELLRPGNESFAALRTEDDAHRFVDQTLELARHVDAAFSVDLCLRLAVPTLDATRRLLAHAQQQAGDNPELTARVGETSQRLGTWSMIGDTEPFDWRGWSVFRAADLAVCARAYAAQGDVARVSAIWRRHPNDTRLRDDVAGAVQGFPMDTDARALVAWLRAEVLPALATPQQWHGIAAWIEQRARVLEAKLQQPADALQLVALLDPATWPDGGALSADTNSLLTPQQLIDGSQAAARWAGGLAAELDNATQSCAFLRQQLRDVAHLRTAHGMTLTLDEYAQLSYSMVATELLDRVAAPELLEAAYFEHFEPYARRHGLDYAQLVRDYCLEVMGAAVDSAWEPRVLQLLTCLHASIGGKRAAGQDSLAQTSPRTAQVQTLSAVTLEAMRRSAIPWSDGVNTAAHRALALLERYADTEEELARAQTEVREQLRLMRLRRMLQAHGLPDTRISDTRMAHTLLQWLARRPSADMRDVLQLADAYHHLSRTAAYVMRLQTLCETGTADDAAALLHFIDAEEPVAGRSYIPLEVARRTLCWVREALDSMTFGGDASRTEFRQLTAAAVAIVRTLDTLAVQREQDIESSELARLRKLVDAEGAALRTMWQLLADGNLMVSPGELEQLSAREQILADILRQQWLEPCASGPDCAPETLGLPLLPARIRTLATMLRFTPAQLSTTIVTQCLSLRLFTMALDVCQQLVDTLQTREPPTDDVDCVLRALSACERGVGRFLAELASGDKPALPMTLHGMLVRRLAAVCQSAALKCAAQAHLVRFLDAHACWSLASTVFDQTTDGDFSLLTRAESSGGADAELGDTAAWLGDLYADLYTERGLVLDTAPAMHRVYQLISALLRLPAVNVGDAEPDLAISDPGSPSAAPSPARGKAAAVSVTPAAMGNDDAAYLEALEPDYVRGEVVRRCGALVSTLSRNRHWMLAVQAAELTTSQLARSSFVVSHEDPDDGEALGQLRRRLEAGGVEEAEVAELLGAAAGTDAADVANLASRSLVRALQQPGMDAPFIFACMLSAAPPTAYQHLSTAMSHSGLLPARVVALAGVGAACSQVWQQQALLDRCRSVAAAARWSEQLRLLRLRFDVALLSDPTPERLEPLVRPMLIRTNMDIGTLLEFADAFRLDSTFVILEYISLCCSAPHVDSYQARVLGVADEVANPKLLERTYTDALENCISAYDYERLQFVVQRLQELRPQDAILSRHAAVLDILCTYDRKYPPATDELHAEWSRTRAARDANRRICTETDDTSAMVAAAAAADTAGNPAGMPSFLELTAENPLAARRLPFHGLVGSNPWTTLLSELSTETVDMLLPLAPSLEINEDDFYMNLIDSLLRKWRSNDTTATTDTTSSDTTSSDEAAAALAAYERAMDKTPTRFNSIQHLIRCFKDPEAAISTIKHAADEFPCGPDRVAALKMGIKLLHKWGQYIKRTPDPERKQVMAKAETIYLHFEKSYADAMTEITLRRNRLEKYLPLFSNVGDADSAIRVLTAVFEGECTAQLHRSGRDKSEQLHEVLRKLAAIYDTSLETLLQTLLTRYLESPVELTSSSAELQLPSTRYQASIRHMQSDEALLRRRVVYILGHISESVKLLLSFAYSIKAGISCLSRARALDILFSVASYDDIAQQQQPEDVRRYFQALLYLGDFEYAGIPQTIADFLDCQKAALARSIWVEHHQNPKAVQLICNLCLDFGFNDQELVLRMFPRLLAAKLFRYVVGVLDIISTMPCYASIDELAGFWNQAVSSYLLQLSRSDGSDWIGAALAVLGTCIRSPHLLNIDSSSMVQSLVRNASGGDTSSIALCLACVVFDVFPYRRASKECLLSCIDGMDPEPLGQLVQGLLEFDNAETIASSSQLSIDWTGSRSLTAIFDLIDEHGIHEQTLLRAPPSTLVRVFVRNRILNDKLLAAVNMCIERGKRQLALQLVSQYYSVRSVDVLAEDAQRAEIALDSVAATVNADGGDCTRDLDTTMDSGTPHGTLDISIAARKRVSRIPDSLKLDIYIRSHK
ncbi:hypothetical protein H4R23_000324 [Coemansia sp. Cherry 401B]|nr:hypothetical protein H4R23_000324 [Coemansia sp. Cherry 401B]